MALALLAGDVRDARAQPLAEVSAAVANGFARLVFTLPEDVTAEVRQGNGIIIVEFTRPLDILIEHVAGATPGYIGVARRDPDGTAVRFALARKVTINTMTAGEKLFVDLLPEGWQGLPPGLPQEVVDDLARRARDAERRARQQRQADPQAPPAAIRVRVASLPTFTRYVFDLRQPAAVAVNRGRDALSLVFDAPLKFDLADAKAALPKTVAALDAEADAESATVRFTFVGKVDVRTFREEGAFVVDVSATANRPQAGASPGAGQDDTSQPQWLPPAGNDPGSRRAAMQPPGPAPAPQQTPGNGAPQQARPAAPVAAAGGPVENVPRAAPAREQPPSNPPAGQPSAPAGGAPPAPAAPPPDPNAPVAATVKRQGETLRIVFPFHAKTSAAVFRRADTLWLVFDSAAPLDLKRLRDDSHGAIRQVSIAPSGQGQVVRIKLERPRLSSIAADDAAWVVTLGDAVLEPTAALTIARARSGPEHAVAVIPFQQPQHVHRLTDPDVGDALLVVTAHAPARGFLKNQELVDFRALASTHGVALEPAVEDLAAELAADRIAVTRPSGLALTPSADPGAGGSFSVHRPLALDVQSWGFDRQAKFVERRSSLMNAVAEAPENRRAAARLDFARFYLARDMFAEAKGLLDITLANERDHNEVATALVLRGIANLMQGRDDLALKDLGAPALGNQHDAPMWRAVALSRQGRFNEAREGLANVETGTAGLPVELQRLVLREAARCALEVGDLTDAARRLNDLETIGVPHNLRPGVSLLIGRLAEALSRPEDAMAAYRAAAESLDQPSAAQGRLRMVTLRNAGKQIKRGDAVAELERLAAGWRGDETEAETLQWLARFYSEDGRFRDALLLMRIALTVHPRSPITRRIQDEAAAVFEGIFLGDRGMSLSPIEALGLFYDFRNLTPAGRRGDEMIRRLAERLVAMDLLTQASELLQHQVDHRLQGAARAQVATRLAMIYLMHRKPDRALTVLRATRVNDLPADLRSQRLLLEARALSDSGRHDLALDIIETMPGREVDRLRADIHWAARHWRESAEEIERMYGERWREPEPLDAVERTDVLRAAIGYSLAEEFLGLDRFRQKYGPKMADSADARMFQVVTAPLTGRTPEFAEIARAASSIDTLEAFLRDLRARYPESGATATAPAAARSGS